MLFIRARGRGELPLRHGATVPSDATTVAVGAGRKKPADKWGPRAIERKPAGPNGLRNWGGDGPEREKGLGKLFFFFLSKITYHGMMQEIYLNKFINFVLLHF